MTRRQDCVTCQATGYVGLDREGVRLGLELPDTCPDCVVVDKPISVTCQDCYTREDLDEVRTLAVLEAEGWTIADEEGDPDFCKRCTRLRGQDVGPADIYEVGA